jgi:hypothetical protein
MDVCTIPSKHRDVEMTNSRKKRRKKRQDQTSAEEYFVKP